MRVVLGSSATGFCSSLVPLASYAFAFAFAPLAGCSSNTTPPAASPFQGQWTCSVVDNLTFTTPANGEPESNATSPLITIVADISGNLGMTGLVDAGATCPLQFTSSGSKATLASGQSCSSGTISLTYANGTASVTGSALSATITYTFAGTVVAPVDGGADGGTTTNESVAGAGTSTYTCTKNGT